MSRLPLEGIRIADFTQVVQGPYATMMMAMMGAEVIKMETASRYPGDSRDLGPFVRNNISKKSVSIDFKHPKGVALAKEIVKVSDLVTENFGTGVIERLGLGYEELRKVKPDVIMLCSTGLGRRGPYKNAIGYYAEVANFAGLSYLSGLQGGQARAGGGNLGGPPDWDAHCVCGAVRASSPPQDRAGPVHRDVHGRKRHSRTAGAVP